MWKIDTTNSIITLQSADNCNSCNIYLYGATITSWICNNKERLLLSQTAILNGSKAIRGGIPIVSPVFGPSDHMPQHGFARTSTWNILSRNTSKDDKATVTLQLVSSPETLKVWPFQFCLEYHVELSSQSLKCTLSMKNIGSESFSCHSLLHTYLRIPDIHSLVVTGLQNLQYHDKLKNNDLLTESEHSIIINKEVDRIYINSTSDISLASSHKEEDIFMNISKTSFLTTTEVVYNGSNIENCSKTDVETDVVLWNPWIDKSLTLADLDDEAYLEFVCVEPGTVSKLIDVPVGTTLCLSQTLTCRQ